MDLLDKNKVLEFLRLVNNLKHSVRKGWEYRGIQNAESIASHMYSMGIMTFLLGDNSNLDRLRCLQLALVHDLAECIVGDITPQDNVPKDVKYKLEDQAMKELTARLDSEVGKIIYELYKEYERKETPEARFVKDLDQFDMILTATEYEEKDKAPRKLQEFFDSTHGKFEHPFIKQLVDVLEQQRKCNDSLEKCELE
ncbi:hypothetical protein ILUMI_23209 [Ignelater luminosus]|uniref:5'-deoxynucleotidase HDDC2 n=1 Tax=Ignelater luminosus TaxID=2038154 RepID=A0A8K0CCH0_IGNLU|nr:hypothetical protein ILUMI_23209 [Ignelater luminosus]